MPAASNAYCTPPPVASLHLLGAIRIARIERVRGAEYARDGELFLAQVDGDDRFRVEHVRGEERREADAAESDNRDGRAARHARRVDDRAGAGDHGAAEDGGLVERQTRFDANERIAREHGVLGERRDTEEVMRPRDRRSVSRRAPLSSVPAMFAAKPGSHSAGRPAMQGSQAPQLGTNDATT